MSCLRASIRWAHNRLSKLSLLALVWPDNTFVQGLGMRTLEGWWLPTTAASFHISPLIVFMLCFCIRCAFCVQVETLGPWTPEEVVVANDNRLESRIVNDIELSLVISKRRWRAPLCRAWVFRRWRRWSSPTMAA